MRSGDVPVQGKVDLEGCGTEKQMSTERNAVDLLW